MAVHLLLPTTVEYLGLQASRRGDRGGLRFGDRHIPYGELAAAAGGLAEWLARRGIGGGRAVGIRAVNSPALLAAHYAVWSLGGVAVPISARSTREETVRLLEHARAVALIVDADDRKNPGAIGLPVFALQTDPPFRPRMIRRAPAAAARVPRAPRPTDVACIAYTSGTTGAPKGVVISHANLLWATLACAQARGDTEDAVGASISPLTHTPVLVSHVLCRILLGSTVVLFSRFDCAAVLDAVQRHGITDLPLIAGMVHEVLATDVPPVAVRTVQKVSVGGAPTPMQAKQRLAEVFRGAEIIEAYGQSESTNGVTMARRGRVFEKPGTVGRPNPHVAVTVRRRDGDPAELGEEGEIVIGGPTVMRGYFRNRAATVEVLRDGWLHTGDLGYRDADGDLFVTGRIRDLIISGGENIAPQEIEEVVRRHPAVAEAAVIGVPHPKWGEQVAAVIVLRPGRVLEPHEIEALTRRHLAAFKIPRRIEIVDELPRNAARKVATATLREWLTGAPPKRDSPPG